MPVERKLKSGQTSPTINPLTGPTNIPAKKTGTCMGEKILPDRATWWKTMGRVIPRVTKRAVKVISLLVSLIISVGGWQFPAANSAVCRLETDEYSPS
jgi:hypothetical protein